MKNINILLNLSDVTDNDIVFEWIPSEQDNTPFQKYIMFIKDGKSLYVGYLDGHVIEFPDDGGLFMSRYFQNTLNVYKKAAKYDKLDSAIGEYYKEDEMIDEDDMEGDEWDNGLLGIGELAATHFGYMV